MSPPPVDRVAPEPLSSPRRGSSSLRLAVGYFLAGLVWVWLSDAALYAIGTQTVAGFLLSGGKGSLFFLVTAPLFYWLIRKDLQTVTRLNGLLTAVSEGTNEAVFVKDREGRYLFFNKAASRLVGKSVAEVLGRDDTYLFEPESAERVRSADQRVIESGSSVTTEERLTAAGVDRVHLTTLAPLRDASREIIGVVGISRDISDRVRAEAVLRDREHLLAVVTDNARVGLVVVGPGYEYLFANAAYSEVLGLPVGEIVGRRVPDVLQAGWDQVRPRLDSALAGEPQSYDLSLPSRGASEERHFRVMYEPQTDANGRTTVVFVVIDVTDQRRAEAEARMQAEFAQAVLDAVAANVAVLDLDGHIVAVNAAWRSFAKECGIDGVSGGPGVGANYLAVCEASAAAGCWDGGIASAAIRRVLSGEADQVALDYPCHSPTEQRWFLMNVTPFRAGRGGVVISHTNVTTLRLAEEAVRRGEERARRGEALLSAILEALPVSVIIANEDGRLVRMNPASRAIWGPAPLSAGVDSYHEYVGYWPETGERIAPRDWPMSRAVLAGETSVGVRVEIERFGDGTRRLLDLSAAPVVGDDGRRLGGVVACMDVTERVRAETALRESETRLREAQRIARLGSWAWEPPTNRVWWSDAIYELFGVPQTVVPSFEQFLALLHPDDRAIARARVDAVLAGDDGFANDLRIVRPDGQITWIRSEARATRDAAGQLVRVEGFDQDVTDQKLAEATLRESEWRFRNVFEHAVTGIAITDADGRFLQCNPACCAILGRTEEELRNSALAELIHPDDRDENMALLLQLSAGEIPRYEVENRFLHKSGEPRWVHKWVTALKSESGRPSCLMALVTDVTEMRRAERELREGEEQLRLAVRAANIGLWDWDMKTERLLFSPEWKAQLGYAPDEVGNTFAEWESRVHPDDLGPSLERVKQTLTGPEDSHESEFRMRHKDGSWRWIFTRAEVFRDKTGAPIRMLGGHVDVTARRLAEESLRASEERYRRLVEVLPEAVFINADNHVIYCNPACVALFGARDAGALVGKSPFDLFDPEFHDAIRTRIQTMRETGAAVAGLDERILRLDGRVAPVQVVATPISDGGRPAILVCLRDLSERERTLELLRTVLGSVSDAILTIDARGTVESANPATERMFGYTEEQLLGKNVRTLMPEPDRGRHDGYISNYVRTGEAKVIGVGREVDGRRKDGTTFPVELTVTEFLLDGERRFTGVLRDITSRRRLEEQFRQAQKMEAVGRLAGGVAHDFNNLLTVINGYCDLVLFDLSPDSPSRVPLTAVREAGERAAALTSQLLAFSRKAIVAPRVFDLKEVAAQSEKLLRRLIGEDIVLALVLDPAPCLVNADPNQVDQVILNLAVNARDAMPTGGRLTIEVRPTSVPEGANGAQTGVRPGRYVELVVSDNGCGMNQAIQARIFEPFFTTKGEGRGTGLGLATVFGIVNQAGGHVSVDSVVDQGTTFRVLLPAITGPATGADIARTTTTRGKETVLLVEDDAAVRQLSRLALETQGYEVLVAANGREALQLLRSRPGKVDLVVTDVVMPEMSGRELADAVRTAQPGTRVLFVSGYTDDAVVRHGVREAADAFLQKPFTPLGLARKVRQVLDA